MKRYCFRFVFTDGRDLVLFTHVREDAVATRQATRGDNTNKSAVWTEDLFHEGVGDRKVLHRVNVLHVLVVEEWEES